MISGAAGVLTPCRVGVWVSCGHGVATARVTGVNNLHVSRRIVDGGTCSTVLCTVTTVELARIPRGDKVFVVDGGRLRRLGPCPHRPRPRRPPNTRSDRFGQHGIRNFTTSSIGTGSTRGASASRYGQPTVELSKLSTVVVVAKGSVESTHSDTKYHAPATTTRRTGQTSAGTAVVSFGGLIHRRGFQRSGQTPRRPAILHLHAHVHVHLSSRQDAQFTGPHTA